MTTKETLKKWFRTGEKPTQAQFWAWLESYHHKEETIPAKSVEGLPQLMERSLVQNQFENHQTDPLAHAELFENKVDKEQGKGLSANDFTDEYKQQLDELAQREKTEIDTENFFLKDEKITLIQGTNTEAPLNFQQGNLTYSPRNGQVEYSENGLFFTHDNQRRQVVFIDDTGLTTQQIAQKLKRIIKGEQFTIKYTDGTMTSAKYDELLNAVRDKQVEEISVNTAGLEDKDFNIKEKYTEFFISKKFKDVLDGTKSNEYENSGFYIDAFDVDSRELLRRNKLFLKDFSTYDKIINVPKRNQFFLRVTKFGDYKDYELKLYVHLYKQGTTYGSIGAIIKMNFDQEEVLVIGEKEKETYSAINIWASHESSFNVMIAKRIIPSTLTNLFVNDTPVSGAESFGVFRNSHASFYDSSNNRFLLDLVRMKDGTNKDYVRNKLGKGRFIGYVGDYIDGIDYSLENVENDIQIQLKTTDKLKGYYKIQLINTENQEVVFEKDNREDNTDTITLNNLQLPKMLTIKLWTNDSLND